MGAHAHAYRIFINIKHSWFKHLLLHVLFIFTVSSSWYIYLNNLINWSAFYDRWFVSQKFNGLLHTSLQSRRRSIILMLLVPSFVQF